MTLSNPFEPPHLDGSPIARRRVTRRSTGAAPLIDDDVPVLLRIADFTVRDRAVIDPVKPEPPSAGMRDPLDIEEPVTLKFVAASNGSSVLPTAPTDSTVPTEPSDSTNSTESSDSTETSDSTVRTAEPDPSDPSNSTTARSRDLKPKRKLSGERRRREISPPVETRKSVASQWGVIIVLVVAIAAVYLAFTNKSNDKSDAAKSNRDDKPSANFVPANSEPAPADAKTAAPSQARKGNETNADSAVPPIIPKTSGDPPTIDTTIAPTLDGPRQETQDRRPAPPPSNRRAAPPIDDRDAPPTDGPIEREARQPEVRQPAVPSDYPETDPATYDFAPENRRAAAPPPENVYEVGSARLNGVQPLPPRDRR